LLYLMALLPTLILTPVSWKLMGSVLPIAAAYVRNFNSPDRGSNLAYSFAPTIHNAVLSIICNDYFVQKSFEGIFVLLCPVFLLQIALKNRFL